MKSYTDSKDLRQNRSSERPVVTRQAYWHARRALHSFEVHSTVEVYTDVHVPFNDGSNSAHIVVKTVVKEQGG
jgi:hypothetical protein